MASPPTWETLGYIIGAVGATLAVYFRLAASFASKEAISTLDQRIGNMEKTHNVCHAECVTRENLILQLRPITDEQAHRKRSMESLGGEVVKIKNVVTRMDKTIFLIAAKLDIDLPTERDGG